MISKNYKFEKSELLSDLEDGIITQAEYDKAVKNLKRVYRKPVDKREEINYE